MIPTNKTVLKSRNYQHETHISVKNNLISYNTNAIH